MADRRSFLRNVAAISGGIFLTPNLSKSSELELQSFNKKHQSATAAEIAEDEAFWYWVRKAFTGSENIINLNSGVVSPQPKSVQDAFDRYVRMSNEAPPLYNNRIIEQGFDSIKMKLSQLAGCSPQEIAMNRNTTEALENIIFGLNLEKGDEVVLSKLDHHRIKYAWNQRAQRDGVVLKWVELDAAMDAKDQIVKRFTNQFTSRTKLVELTHLINWSGQILPVRAIADEAKNVTLKSWSMVHTHFAILTFESPI